MDYISHLTIAPLKEKTLSPKLSTNKMFSNNLKMHLSAERVFTYISSFLFPSKSRGDDCRHSWNHRLLFHCVLVPAAPLPLLTGEV